MTILLLTLAVFLLYLAFEALQLRRLRRRIPLVIAVTGTRGKSSVARILASILHEDGKTVLAKTTGSQAQYVLPDGSVEEIRRRGVPSIIEQKKVLKRAVETGAECLIVEIMSIQSGYHYVESQRILRPDIVILTNVRQDHTDAMGQTETEIGRILSLDIPRGAKAYIPEELQSLIGPNLPKSGQPSIITVRRGFSDHLVAERPELRTREFLENLDLVAAVATGLNIDDRTIASGALKTVYDIGKLRVWRTSIRGKLVYLANAFAANDPESTLRVIEKLKATIPANRGAFTGLMSLRGDRGDRTVQWIGALRNGMSGHFRRLYVIGEHAHALRRRVAGVELLHPSDPKEITERIATEMEQGGMLLGFGNIGEMGKRLVEHWQRVGEDYGL